MPQGNHPDHPPVEGGYTGSTKLKIYPKIRQVHIIYQDGFGLVTQGTKYFGNDSSRNLDAHELNCWLEYFGLKVTAL